MIASNKIYSRDTGDKVFQHPPTCSSFELVLSEVRLNEKGALLLQGTTAVTVDSGVWIRLPGFAPWLTVVMFERADNDTILSRAGHYQYKGGLWFSLRIQLGPNWPWTRNSWTRSSRKLAQRSRGLSEKPLKEPEHELLSFEMTRNVIRESSVSSGPTLKPWRQI